MKRNKKRRGKRLGRGNVEERKRKEEVAAPLIPEEERKRKGQEEGSSRGLQLLFEQMGLAKVSLVVSLVVSLISPLACTQLCVNQLLMSQL